MAVIPQNRARRTLDTGRGSIPNVRISDAPGRALQQVGSALTAFAQRAEQQQEELASFKASTGLVDFQAEADKLLRESQNNLVPGAEGFHDQAIGQFDEMATNFTSTITNPRVREKAELAIRRTRNSFSSKAAKTEFDERTRFFDSELNRVSEGFLTTIDQNPGSIQESTELFISNVEDSGLPPIQKQEKIQAFRELAIERALQSVGKSNPALAKRVMNQIRRLQAKRFKANADGQTSQSRIGAGARPGAGTVQKTIVDTANGSGIDPLVMLGIAKIESGFNPKAKNPRSSAAGVFQFVSSTGKRFGLPKNAANATIARQVRAGTKLTSENISGLKSALGRDPTPGETYMAHFLGLGGARNILSVSRGTELRKALGPNAKAIIRANPFMRKMKTAGDLVKWADGKMFSAMKSTASLIQGGEKTLPNKLDTSQVPNQVDPKVVQFTQISGPRNITTEDPPEGETLLSGERITLDPEISSGTTAQKDLDEETIQALVDQAARLPNIDQIPEDEVNERSITEPVEFLDDALEASVQVPETELPEEVKPILQAAVQGQVVIGAKSFARVSQGISTAEKAFERAEEDFERDQGDDVFKDLLSLSARNQLTIEQVEENKDILSASQFSQLLRAAGGTASSKSDPTVFADLLNRADEDPEGVQAEALQAFSQGLLRQEDMSKLFTITRSVENRRPVWFKSVKDFVRFSLKPPDPIFDLDGSLARKQQQAVLDFEEFFLNNPEVTFEEARKRADELVGQSRDGNVTDNVPKIDIPAFIQGTPTIEKLNTARDKIQGMLDSGQITQDEALKQGRLIMKWMNTLGTTQ